MSMSIDTSSMSSSKSTSASGGGGSLGGSSAKSTTAAAAPAASTSVKPSVGHAKSVALPSAASVANAANQAGAVINREVQVAVDTTASALKAILEQIGKICDSCKHDNGFSASLGASVFTIAVLNLYNRSK